MDSRGIGETAPRKGHAVPAGRLFALRSMLEDSKLPVLSLGELSERLGVSAQTVRRDLSKLEKQGVVRRTIGGAILVRASQRSEPDFENRSAEMAAEKKVIAAAAAELIVEGDSVFFDASSTVLQLIRAIPRDLQGIAVSSSLMAMAELIDCTGLQLTVVGGEIRVSSRCTGGDVAFQQVARMRFGTAYLSARAVHCKLGLTEGNADEATLKRLIVDNSERIVVLIDSSKLGKSAPHHFADVERIDVIITDSGAEDGVVECLRERCADVRVVESVHR